MLTALTKEEPPVPGRMRKSGVFLSVQTPQNVPGHSMKFIGSRIQTQTGKFITMT